MLFVTDSVQLMQQVCYQGSSWRVWRLQNRRTSNLHSEICISPATGKDKTVLQSMIDIETGRYCGMEMNVGNTKVVRISRQPSLVQIMIDQKQLENVAYLNYLDTMINDTRCTCEIISKIVMAKVALNRNKVDLNLKFKLVQCYIWSIALYGAEIWTLLKVDQKYLESFEVWYLLEKDEEDDLVRSCGK